LHFITFLIDVFVYFEDGPFVKFVFQHKRPIALGDYVPLSLDVEDEFGDVLVNTRLNDVTFELKFLLTFLLFVI